MCIRDSRTSWRILTEMLDEINEPGVPTARFNIALVVGPGEAQLHLAFHSCPWLMREIPLDPDNPFVNAQIIAGEVSRSARFVTNSLDGEFSGGITLMGASEKIDFIADYLGEEVGIRTQAVSYTHLAGIGRFRRNTELHNMLAWGRSEMQKSACKVSSGRLLC